MCSSGWGQSDLFCESCWKILQLEEQHRRGFFVTADFPVSTLWNWKVSTKTVECLIRAQKSITIESARARIIRRYLTYILGEAPTKIVYVIPKNKCRDHASEGARVLAKHLGVPVIALQIEPREHYKTKTRRERALIVDFETQYKPRKSERVWFYDDVITTGCTAKAVWAALGKPHRFQAVALVYREKQ